MSFSTIKLRMYRKPSQYFHHLFHEMKIKRKIIRRNFVKKKKKRIEGNTANQKEIPSAKN